MNGDLYFSDGYPLAREDKVVHHEYGHAVIRNINSNIISSDDEEGAISEGTPDYWTGSFTGRSKILDCLSHSLNAIWPIQRLLHIHNMSRKNL